MDYILCLERRDERQTLRRTRRDNKEGTVPRRIRGTLNRGEMQVKVGERRLVK